MYTAEVVPHHEESDSGFQVRQLLAESVGQARKTPQVHPHAQIRSLNMAGGDVFNLGVSAYWDWYRIHNLARGLAGANTGCPKTHRRVTEVCFCFQREYQKARPVPWFSKTRLICYSVTARDMPNAEGTLYAATQD